MPIRIEMAKDGDCKNYGVANGVKVFTDTNVEITGIMSIDVRFRLDEVVTATIEVAVSRDTELKDLLPLFEVSTLEELALSRGYKLVPYKEPSA